MIPPGTSAKNLASPGMGLSQPHAPGRPQVRRCFGRDGAGCGEKASWAARRLSLARALTPKSRPLVREFLTFWFIASPPSVEVLWMPPALTASTTDHAIASALGLVQKRLGATSAACCASLASFCSRA